MSDPAADLGAMEAVIFDLDGVVTRTAEVHAEAWKQLFDEYLAVRARRFGEPFEAFDRRSDYRRFVDGKPRYEGIASFLASRGIELPFGSPDDPEERETVCGLGNRKNRYFLEALERTGADPYPTTLQLIAKLRARGVRTAIVSSSRNCVAVLEAAGIRELFEVKVDGLDAAELGLAGKPDPALFLEAARRLGVEPAHAAVVEDAISGVEAGRQGRFGFVVGVDRAEQREALTAAGANLVVRRPGRGRGMSAWVLEYEGFDPASEGLREALCALGNGFLATRGAAPEAQADEVHYPGDLCGGGLQPPAYHRRGPHARGREHRQPPELAPADVPRRGRVLARGSRVPRASSRARPPPRCAYPVHTGLRRRRPRDSADAAAHRLDGQPAPGRTRDDRCPRELVGSPAMFARSSTETSSTPESGAIARWPEITSRRSRPQRWTRARSSSGP